MSFINVIGLGYVGLPTAIVLAKSGVQVVGTDINSDLVKNLQEGKHTFDEIELQEAYYEALSNGIEFTTEYKKAVTYILAVPTPMINGSIDLSDTIHALNSVLDVCDKGATIVFGSKISEAILERQLQPEVVRRELVVGEDVNLVLTPEGDQTDEAVLV